MPDADNTVAITVPGKNGGRLMAPWQPGAPTPNPKGRPKSRPITEAYLAALTPAARAAVARAIIGRAKRGSVIAAKEITDRVEGAVSRADGDGDNRGGSVTVVFVQAILERPDFDSALDAVRAEHERLLVEGELTDGTRGNAE